MSVEGLSDDRLLYGSVIGSLLCGAFIVEFDLLPNGEDQVTVPRSHIITIDKNSKEPIYGHIKSVEATTIIDDGEEEWDAVLDENNDSGTKNQCKRRILGQL